MQKKIINADDFGMSQSVNKAIMRCFELGVISSATLMSNMEFTDEAINHALDSNYSVGVHLNLIDGRPLTQEILKSNLFTKNGNFCFRLNRNQLFLSRKNSDLIYIELREQIIKLRRNGINLTHIDSHHHVHTIFPIFLVVLRLSKEFQLPVRVPRTTGSNSIHRIIYKKILNKILCFNKANLTEEFINYDEYIEGYQIKVDTEIMVHPSIKNGKVYCSTTSKYICDL